MVDSWWISSVQSRPPTGISLLRSTGWRSTMFDAVWPPRRIKKVNLVPHKAFSEYVQNTYTSFSEFLNIKVYSSIVLAPKIVLIWRGAILSHFSNIAFKLTMSLLKQCFSSFTYHVALYNLIAYCVPAILRITCTCFAKSSQVNVKAPVIEMPTRY